MTKHTLFISDLHLQEDMPEVTDYFLRFTEGLALTADALYILGDLFEAWIGDDDLTPYHQKIINALRKLTEQGLPVYFMHGNRDFLIGQRFCQATGIKLLTDPSLIELYGHPLLLMHGDSLCTLDIKHQKYRRKVANPVLQWLFLRTPLSWRRKVANAMRQRSMTHNRNASRDITDVNPVDVAKEMQKQHVTLLIHGHTHRPAIHEVNLSNEQAGQRIVLGAWHDDAMILSFHPDGSYQLFDYYSATSHPTMLATTKIARKETCLNCHPQ